MGTGKRILAGDIGATKSNLALYEAAGGRLDPEPVRETRFASGDFPGLEAMLAGFLGADARSVSAAVFGIAGPLFDGRVTGINFPWVVDVEAIRRALACDRVRLMNDLETTAYGTLFLRPSDLLTLQEGETRHGNRAVIAAGTGLGQGILFWDGTRYHPSATEGGHADFAPRNAMECRLLEFLLEGSGHVPYESTLSGPGLHNIFRFLTERVGRSVPPDIARRLAEEDPNAVIGEAGASGACSTCEEAVDFFLGLYGAQAGNLALTVMATGGVFVGGGIVVKMLEKMRSGRFLEAFLAKGRYRDIFMRRIPVHVVLEPRTAMIGAAHAAFDLLSR